MARKSIAKAPNQKVAYQPNLVSSSKMHDSHDGFHMNFTLVGTEIQSLIGIQGSASGIVCNEKDD